MEHAEEEKYSNEQFTLEDLIQDLNVVLERVLSNRGDKDKTIYDLKESYTAGFHDGSEETILYVLKNIQELDK